MSYQNNVAITNHYRLCSFLPMIYQCTHHECQLVKWHSSQTTAYRTIHLSKILSLYTASILHYASAAPIKLQKPHGQLVDIMHSPTILRAAVTSLNELKVFWLTFTHTPHGQPTDAVHSPASVRTIQSFPIWASCVFDVNWKKGFLQKAESLIVALSTVLSHCKIFEGNAFTMWNSTVDIHWTGVHFAICHLISLLSLPTIYQHAQQEHPLTWCCHQRPLVFAVSHRQSINTHCECPLLWCCHQRSLAFAVSHQQSINTHCECPLLWCCRQRSLVFAVSHQQSINTHCKCPLLWCCHQRSLLFAVSHQQSINTHCEHPLTWCHHHRSLVHAVSHQSINTHCECPLLWCHLQRSPDYAVSHQQSINTHRECPLRWCCHDRSLVFEVSHQQSFNVHTKNVNHVIWCTWWLLTNSPSVHALWMSNDTFLPSQTFHSSLFLPIADHYISAVSYQGSINAHTMNVNLGNGTHHRQQDQEPHVSPTLFCTQQAFCTMPVLNQLSYMSLMVSQQMPCTALRVWAPSKASQSGLAVPLMSTERRDIINNIKCSCDFLQWAEGTLVDFHTHTPWSANRCRAPPCECGHHPRLPNPG